MLTANWAMAAPSETDIPEQIFPTPQPPGSAVTRISAGYEHSLFLKSDGSLWAMGDDSFGQLGYGGTDNKSTNKPEQIVGNVAAIAAGFNHSLFIGTDGGLWAMGWNGEGELGDGTKTFRSTPEVIVLSNALLRSPREWIIACFANPMAVFGRWVSTLWASLATAQRATPSCRSRLFPAMSWQLRREQLTPCFSNPTAATSGHGLQI